MHVLCRLEDVDDRDDVRVLLVARLGAHAPQDRDLAREVLGVRHERAPHRLHRVPFARAPAHHTADHAKAACAEDVFTARVHLVKLVVQSDFFDRKEVGSLESFATKHLGHSGEHRGEDRCSSHERVADQLGGWQSKEVEYSEEVEVE